MRNTEKKQHVRSLNDSAVDMMGVMEGDPLTAKPFQQRWSSPMIIARPADELVSTELLFTPTAMQSDKRLQICFCFKTILQMSDMLLLNVCDDANVAEVSSPSCSSRNTAV